MIIVQTVFLNDDESPLTIGGPAIDIKYPTLPIMGDRLNFDMMDNPIIDQYIDSVKTSTFIVLSRHLFASSSDTSNITLFVTPFHPLH